MTYTGSTLTATQVTNAAGQPVTVRDASGSGRRRATLPNGEAFTANTAAGTLVWTPSAAVTDDRAASPARPRRVTETGASDRDF